MLAGIIRRLAGLTRPNANSNRRRLAARGESLDAFVLREATPADLPALVDLHVTLWNKTYPLYHPKPTHAIRERQWQHAFECGNPDSWCCFVLERSDGTLIGFAKGILSEHPEYGGELSKIYLRWDYHRLGLGRRLMEAVAHWFLDRGITSMVLFAEASNPSCGFYEAMGGVMLPHDNGRKSGNYGWKDLGKLV